MEISPLGPRTLHYRRGSGAGDRFPGRLHDPVIVDTPGSHEANLTRSSELAEAILRVVSG
jgi:hypothetical protein